MYSKTKDTREWLRPVRRLLVLTMLTLACMGVAQAQTYTVYYSTIGYDGWSGSGDYYHLYIQVYYSDPATGDPTYYTSGTYGSEEHWDTCTPTSIEYVYSWTYNGTGEIPEGAVCKFRDDWGQSYTEAVTFVSGYTYFANGTTYGENMLVYNPANWSSVNDELSGFKISCANGIALNESSGSTITITNGSTTVNDVSVSADVTDGLTANITISPSITDVGSYYTITIPSGYFLLGEGKTQSEESSVSYNVVTTATVTYYYTIYFDNTGNWSNVYATVIDPVDYEQENYIYYVTHEQINYDETSEKYVLTFESNTDLSTLSNATIWFDDNASGSSESTWYSFANCATYTPDGIDLDRNYTFYFDWNCIYWGSQVLAVVYYYNDNNEKSYILGSETDETVTWAGGTIVEDNIYAWSFDNDIPEGKTVYVEIYSPDGGWTMTATEFVNGYIYAKRSDNRGVSYPYGMFCYDEYYGGNGLPHTGTVEISTLSVTHRDPKWSSSVDSSHDTFNKDVKRVNDYSNTLSGDDMLQAANTYVETLYVLKGSTVQLTLPYILYTGVAASAYQRWFDFRTDGNYRYGDYDDLLRPTGIDSNADWNCIYRFANGYVCGSTDSQGRQDVMCSNVTTAMNFYYPKDDELEEFKNSIPANTLGYMQQTDNDFYIVACDLSPYTDYGWDEDDGTYTEPTLAGRALYYIVGIDPGNTSTEAPKNLPSDLQTMWKLLDTSYQGGGNDVDENGKYEKNYLEEYDIVFPARRTSNHTLELVTLSKDASSYIVPGVGDDSGELTIEIDSEDSGKGFSLSESKLEGENRVIHFYNTGDNSEYSNASNGAPWKVEDGTELTILVTKTVNSTTYNIARYHLTFKDEVTPLTQTQVAGLGTVKAEGDTPYWWEEMTYRQPSYMNRNYNKIASLTFDYGSSSDVHEFDEEAQSGFYYFPMDWENTSYAFYDGSTGVVGDGYDWYAPGTTIPEPRGYKDEEETEPIYPQITPTRKIYTQWSMYSLVNVYIGYGDSNIITETDWNNTHEYPSGSDKWYPDTTYTYGNGIRPEEYKPSNQEDDYWLYIDASDRPGSVAEISFDDPICVGTQVFGTALIKSASEPTSDDAAVLFSIVGVDDDGNHTTLYSQCSSQIRMTTYLNMTDEEKKSYGTDMDEDNLNSEVTGKGNTTNEWFQLYFSFYSTEQQNFDHYALKIENYCSSTSGGDYYFDDIELYVVQPEFIAEQIAPICTSDEQEASAVRLMVDFDMLETRMNDTVADDDKSTEDSSDDTVSFMIIDMTEYNNYFTVNTEANPEDEDAIAAAILASTVQFVTGEDEEDVANYMTLKFYVDDEYTEYPIYNGEGDNGNKRVAGENTSDVSDGYFFLYTVDGEEYLAIDCSADISPYKAYKILLLPYDISKDSNGDPIGEEDYAEIFAQCMDDECEIASDFYLTSSTILKINGEAADPTVDYCAGQTVFIQPEVTYYSDEDENTVTVEGEYFDWFFGSEEEYTEVNGDFTDDQYTDGVSLEQALLMFRYFYPTATELSKTETPPITDEDNTSIAFTQAMYDIIAYYLTPEDGGTSYHAKLVLYQQYMEVLIPETYLYLVVQPIEMVIYEEYDETGEPIGDPVDVCFGYVPLTLGVGGDAPSLNAGFGNVEYPGDDYVPNLRLGLEQIAKATTTATTEAVPISVNLRGATYVSNDDEITVDHLGLYENMDELYLVGTDDPDYEEALSDEYFTQYTLPIGKIQELYAKADDPESSYMKIEFYSENYPLREGYSYIVMVNCEEKNAAGEAVGTACQGTLPIEIKVVPEYLVWKGESTSNWNNDSNWKRADRSDIHKTATATDEDPYPTNEANGTDNGFVPMLFTKVIMPKGSEAELYMAGFIAGTDGMLSWQGDEDSMSDEGDDDDDDDDEETTSADVPEHPTPYIMYDLMVYENLTNNTLKTEHYRVNLCDEIHFEPGAQLLHSEQLIYSKAWTDVELEQGPWTLAATPLNGVASGDWYTKKATGTETAEYFTNITFGTDSCDRLDPMVYQRNWSNSGNTIVYTNGTDKGVPAYASTGWSSVYNDVTIPHQAGEGFSVKASRTINASTGEADIKDSLMFRFPKADASYTYQDDNATGTTTATSITRTNPGQLRISALVERSDPDMDDNNVYKKDTILVVLTQTDNDYYIVGNPFTAAMSMKMFIAQNENVKAYWTGDDNGPIAGNGEVTSSGGDDYLLPPYTGFFITIDDESDTEPYSTQPVTICFTEDMQVLSTDFVPTGFSLSATNEQGSSKAYVAYNGSASDNYQLGEDVPLLEDVSWQREGLPMVYTVAGDMAVSINSLRRLVLIPVGVFADENAQYTLSFAGVSKLESPVLVDTYEKTETPITEGLTLDMEGPSHGRYFIRSQGMATDIDDIEETASEVNAVSVYSPVPRTVVVSSDAGLEIVDIYSVGGMLLKRANAGGSVSCTVDGVASGIAIVRVKTAEGTAVRKIRVR